MAQIPSSSMHLDALVTTDLPLDDNLSAELATLRGNLFNGESLECVYRGEPPGLRLFAVTSIRVMMVEDSLYDGRWALTSIPVKGVSGVSFLAGEDEAIDRSRTLGILIARNKHILVCDSVDEARDLHDRIIWTITS